MTYVIYLRCRELEAVFEVVLRVDREAEAYMIMHLLLLSQAGVEVSEVVVELFLLRVLHRRDMRKLLAVLHRCKPWLRP